MSISTLAGRGRDAPAADRRLSVALPVVLAVTLAFVGAACQPAAQDAASGESMEEQQMGAPEISAEQAIEMERGLWEAAAEGDHQGFGEMIAEDVTLVGGAGIVEKQELMAQLEGSTVEAYEVGDFQVMQPGSDVAVVTYSYSETFRAAEADSATTFTGWATSIWENRDGTWLIVFHQSSEAPEGEGQAGG